MTAALRQAWVQLQGASVPYAAAALIFYAVSVVLMGQRWRLVLRGMGQRVRLRDTTFTHLTSVFVNNVTPGRVGGEVFRVAMLRRRTGLPTRQVIASLGWDRLTDAVPVVLMLALSLPTLLRVLPVRVESPLRLGLGAAAAGLLIGGALWRWPRVAALRQRYVQKLAVFTIRRSELFTAMLLSCFLWALDSFRIWLVAAALQVPLSGWQAVPLSMVVLLGGLFPTIGGLGAVEGGLTAALCLFGARLEQALAVTALERGISYVLATGAGGALLAALGGGSLWRAARGKGAAAQSGEDPAADTTEQLAAPVEGDASPARPLLPSELAAGPTVPLNH